MSETWIDIQGYSGLYQVSSMGNVRSLKRTVLHPHSKTRTYPAKMIIPKTAGHRGYRYVRLSKGGHTEKWKIARLVALHFIPNPENKRVVNHKNGNKGDDRVSNLEWNTDSENQKHAYAIGLRNPAKGTAHYRSQPVGQFSLDGKLIQKFVSQLAASEATGISQSSIWSVLAEKRKSAGGFLWKRLSA